MLGLRKKNFALEGVYTNERTRARTPTHPPDERQRSERAPRRLVAERSLSPEYPYENQARHEHAIVEVFTYRERSTPCSPRSLKVYNELEHAPRQTSVREVNAHSCEPASTLGALAEIGCRAKLVARVPVREPGTPRACHRRCVSRS